jgi:plasmid stabilization system protein ParE
MERYEQAENSGQNTGAGSIQGEGDYRSARGYREDVKEYLEHADVERAARAAAPRTASEARELEEAEEIGRSRAQHLPQRSYARSSVERVPGALRSMGRVVQERPLLAIALAGALGCLLAWIARSRREVW